MDAALSESAIGDAELHAAWRGGNRQAGLDLVYHYRPRLVLFGERLGLTLAASEDLAQDVLLRAYGSAFVARPGASYWHWLAAIARHRANDLREKQAELPVRRQTTPWSSLTRKRLLATVESMPRAFRVVFVPLVLGTSTSEIAVELGITTSAIHMRIMRGRRWLRTRVY